MISRYLDNQRAEPRMKRKMTLPGYVLMGLSAITGGTAIGGGINLVMPTIHEKMNGLATNIQQSFDIKREYKEAGKLRFGRPARNYMERAVLGSDIGITGSETLDEMYEKIRAYIDGYSEEATDAQVLSDRIIQRKVYGK